MSIKCGFSKVDITPKIGTFLSGYSHQRYSTNIHDKLFARIIYFENGSKHFTLIQTDLIAVDKYLVQKINNLSKITNFIYAIHTHSGPGGFFDKRSELLNTAQNIFGENNQELIAFLISQICIGIEEAKVNLAEVEIRAYQSELFGIGSNRQEKSGYFNPELLILELKQKTGKRALIYNFACHPTILDQHNLKISADLPGYVAEKLEQQDILCLFLNGAAGDISTRFTRNESSFEELARLGNLLSNKLIAATQKDHQYQKLSVLDFVQRPIKLQVREIPAIHEAEQDLTEKLTKLNNNNLTRVIQSEVEGAEVNLLYAKHFPNKTEIDSVLCGFVLNNHYVIGIPGELFNALGDDIKKSFPNKKILIGTYFQDYIGYIVPIKEYEYGSYESLSTVLAKGSGEYIVSEAIKLISELEEEK